MVVPQFVREKDADEGQAEGEARAEFGPTDPRRYRKEAAADLGEARLQDIDPGQKAPRDDSADQRGQEEKKVEDEEPARRRRGGGNRAFGGRMLVRNLDLP